MQSMTRIPEYIANAWQNRNGPAVLSTVSEEGIPNIVYTAFIQLHDDDVFLITDHFFNKTRQNILRGSKGTLLFLSEDGKSSYQLKGSFEYLPEGEIIEQIRETMPPGMPGHAAVILKIDSIYAGGEQLV
jgi:predicted pyridoxine 5'-phosphate oxidase superfamily flavin-nucleotide-binding protein